MKTWRRSSGRGIAPALRGGAMSIVLALGALAAHSTARAQPRDEVSELLRVTPSPDGCVNEAALAPRVRRWLERAAPQSELSVTVHADAPQIAFSVLRDGAVIAERRFDVLPADCADRLDAIAVAIAVALEHATGARAGVEGRVAADGAAADAAARRPESRRRSAPDAEPAEPQPRDAAPTTEAQGAAKPAEETRDGAEPEDESDAEPEDDAAADLRSATAASSATRIFAGAAWLIEVLPDGAFAVSAGGELQRSMLRAGAALLITPLASETTLGPGSVRSRVLGARAHACLGTPLGELDLEGCAGLAGGAVLASGEGYPRDQDAAMLWLAGVLRAAARYPESSSISGRLAFDALLSAVRPELETRAPMVQASAAGPVGAAASLELVIALP